MKASIVVASLVASLVACGPAQAPAPPKASAEVLLEVDRAFSEATAEHGLEGFTSFLAEDVSTLRPDSPIIHGKDELAKRWARLLDDPALSIRWTPETGAISDAGDIGYTLGSYEIRITDESGAERTAETGTYVSIWKRQSDGGYKVVFDSGVADSPAAS